jgi:hypothetical protein
MEPNKLYKHYEWDKHTIEPLDFSEFPSAEEVVNHPPHCTIEPIEFDTVIQPKHYHAGSIDVIEFLERYYPERKYTVAEGFAIGSANKYINRYKEKGGIDDLNKAVFFINKLKGYEAGSDEKAQ